MCFSRIADQCPIYVNVKCRLWNQSMPVTRDLAEEIYPISQSQSHSIMNRICIFIPYAKAKYLF